MGCHHLERSRQNGIVSRMHVRFQNRRLSVHLEPDVPRMVERFKTADLVVAFNSKGFDNKLLRALGHDIDESNHWDMLEVSRRAAGWTDGALFPKGLRLDDHLSAMFGAQNIKNHGGENAPLWWQEGRMSRSFRIAWLT